MRFIKKIKNTYLLGLLIFSLPSIALSASIGNIIDKGYDLIANVLVPLAFAFCLFFFFYGVAKYIRSGAGGNKAAEGGRRIMIWGILALFLVFSIWGIVALIRSELGIPEVQNPQINRELIPAVDSSIQFH